MSKIVKGVLKIRKKLFKKIKKVFKKIIKSPLGKILMVGVAIYTGGVAMGAWGASGPMSGMFGALAPGGTAAASTTAASSAAAVTSAVPTLAPAITTSALGTAASAAPGIAAAAQTPGMLAQAGSFIKGAGATISKFAAANPLTTSVALQGISSALAPDPGDAAAKLAEEEEARRQARYANLNDVGDVNLMRPSDDTQLATMGGVPWHQRLRNSGNT